MKRLFIALSLLTVASSTQTHSLSGKKTAALIETIIGGGTVGLTASLFQDAGNNIVLEGAKHLYAQAGFGSCIRQIRLHMQQLISDMHSGNVQRTLDIEKAVYIALGLIGAALVIDGVMSLVADEEKA